MNEQQAPNLHVRHSTHVLRLILLAAVVVAVAALSYLILVLRMPLPGFIGEYLAGASLPAELRSATLIAARGADRNVLYRAEAAGFDTETLDAAVVSATVDAAGSARIDRTPEGTFRVLLDDAVVIQDQYPRVGITRAATGNRIAYAQAVDTQAFISPAEAPQLFLDRKRWEVVVYEPATRTTSTLGQGVSPVFVDDTHVVWLAPAGLAIADLVTGETRVLVSDTEGRVPAAALVSPDHSLIAWYASASKSLVLYRISASGAEALPVVDLPSPVRSVALGNDALYIVRSIGLGTEILKQPLAGGELTNLVRLPVSMRVQRLLFGNI